MLSDGLRFRLPVSEVLIIALITVMPISLAGLYSLSQSERSLQVTIGTEFGALAASTAAEVSHFIRERVTQVGRLATEPPLLDAVAAGNKPYAGMNDTAVTAKIAKVEDAWNIVPGEPFVNQIAGSRLSVWLRTFREFDSRILRITVTDEKGATIAFTHKPTHYSQAGEEYWENIRAEGEGAVSLTEIRYDEVTKADYIGIGWPVRDEGSNKFIGAVNVLVDVSGISQIVNQPSLARGKRVWLVRDDGTVIAGPQVTFAQRRKSPEFAAIKDANGALATGQTGYLAASFSDGRSQLIGFAETGLKQDYADFGWVVLMCEDAEQALGAVHLVGRMIALMSMIGLLMVALLVAYFAIHRQQPITDIAELTHEPPAGAGAESGVADEDQHR